MSFAGTPVSSEADFVVLAGQDGHSTRVLGWFEDWNSAEPPETPGQVAAWFQEASQAVQARFRARLETEAHPGPEREERVINGHAVTIEAAPTMARLRSITPAYRLSAEVGGLRMAIDHAQQLAAVHARHLLLTPASQQVEAYLMTWRPHTDHPGVPLGRVFGAGSRWLAEEINEGVVISPRTQFRGLDLPVDFPSLTTARTALLLYMMTERGWKPRLNPVEPTHAHRAEGT